MIMAEDDQLDSVIQTPLLERWPYIEMCRPGKVRNHYTRVTTNTGPKHIKTHLPFFLCESWAVNCGAKVIVVLRNPKDTLVSVYKFYQGMACKCMSA